MNTFHYQIFENTTIKRCFLFPILLHNMEMDIHGLCPIQQNRHLQLSRSMEQGSQMSVVDFIHHNAYFVSMRPSEVYFHPSEFICSYYCHLFWIHGGKQMLLNLVHLAVAKSLQSCPPLCNPIDGSPPDSPVPGVLQARTLEWVAISFSNAWKWKVKGKLLSCVRLLVTPWTAAHQSPLSRGFSGQEYWSGVPLPSLMHLETNVLNIHFILRI